MKRNIIHMLLAVAVVFPVSSALMAEVTVKLRDIVTIDGLKENQIYGYGLVVGLPGTGDSKTSLSKSSLKNFLKGLGLESDDTKTRNVAAVLLTAKLPPFVRIGDRIDITVSSIGDAKSLEGGILVQSSLLGADGNTYAAAQGRLEFPRKTGKEKVVKTVAILTRGAVIERDLSPEIITDNKIFLVLHDFDYGQADRIIKVIKKKYPASAPEMTADGKIKLQIIEKIPLPEFIGTIENMEVAPSDRPRVVINEKDGTIVAGGNIRISEAFVSREGLVVEIEDSEKKGAAAEIKEATTVKDLVDSLNAMGASNGDIIAILKALKDAGSLHAELIIK
ncbi:MAG: flagellar biosynthesis protein FlgI [Spirochaetae bacterium HGW-Spirochaetae-1]|jgi:flagellar P-ring protein precursor FlgI|nr:MAG: flagellar biosynthesis protein FlgI [Spirochaetae bacterium HGW-Spirochaetae-1]